ncbi:Glucanosyltransferase-domain-containing protein [Podospora appendiculata]|uniref:1,3-beta-glucanosyltransferase n=1 Tax=Podospora appendiculata TaxID=314037 RepID=A0AAE1C9M3_9PEZI|nr:Glucanosyltransferase-domain-containing protein [Podospora appendiculata]
MLIHSALLALGATIAAAVAPLEAKDNYFVNPKSGNRFQIVGVAYQPGGSAGYKPEQGRDPLSDGDVCLRDAALMQILGVNVIRVYNLDPDLNHDLCASIFNAAGMYMILDVNSPLVGDSLTSYKPWESYYAGYLNRTFAVVEAFKNYPNTLAFFSGNEVLNNVETGGNVPPYMRAVTRDIKNYVSKHSDRPIPVGYSAADVRDVLFDSFEYFQCAEDGDASDPSRVDIFALNSYSWCGDSTYEESGYDKLVEGFSNSSVPIFYSEYGCNTPSPRVFSEVSTIYGPKMTGVFSGGIVYEYAQEANNFGLVTINADGSAQLLNDFYALKDQYSKLNFTDVQGIKSPTSAAPKPPTCSSKLITTKGFANNFTLPSPPPGTQKIIDNGVSPKPVGKIISVASWTVPHPVKNPDGSTLSNLAVKPLADDATNRPGTNTADGTPTTTATGPTASKTNAAGGRPTFGALPALGLGAFAVMAGIAI